MNEDELKIKLKQVKDFSNKNEEHYVENLPIYMFWSKEDVQTIETILDLYNKEKDSNQWLLKAFDESRNNNIELSKEYCKIQQELQQEKEKNKRNKKIMIDKLDKLKNGVRNDFPITLGKQQPLWEDNYTNYISKDKIKAKIKELEEKSDYWNCDEIEVLKELLEEE